MIEGYKFDIIKQHPYKNQVVEKYKHFEANLKNFQWSEDVCTSQSQIDQAMYVALQGIQKED